MAKVIRRSIPFATAGAKIAKPAPKAPKKHQQAKRGAASTARLLLALVDAIEALRSLDHPSVCVCAACKHQDAMLFQLEMLASVVDADVSPEARDEFWRRRQQRAAA